MRVPRKIGVALTTIAAGMTITHAVLPSSSDTAAKVEQRQQQDWARAELERRRQQQVLGIKQGRGAAAEHATSSETRSVSATGAATADDAAAASGESEADAAADALVDGALKR